MAMDLEHDGKEAARIAELSALYARAPIHRLFGTTLRYDEQLRAIVSLPRHPQLDHALDDTHGGVLAMLVDDAAWFATALHYEGWISTVEFTLRLLEPVRREALTCTGRVIRAGRRLAVAEAELRSASGRLVALGGGTFSASSLPTTPAASAC